MAIKYASNQESNGYLVGDDANLGTNKTTDAVETITRGRNVASVNDTLFVNGDTHDQGVTQFALNKAMLMYPSTWRGVAITGDNATSIFRISAGVVIKLGSFIFRNTATSKTSVVDNTNAGATTEVQYNGCVFDNTGSGQAEHAQYVFNDTWAWGEQIFTNIKFSGYIKERGLNSGNLTISAARTKIVKVGGCEFDVEGSRTSGNIQGIYQQINTASAGDWYFSCSGVTGRFTMPNTNTANLIAIHVVNGKTSNSIAISNNVFTINSLTTQTQRGILLEAQNASWPIDSAIVSGNKITCNSSNGHVISIGLNAATNYVTNTKVNGNHVIGNSPTVATPHGITFSQSSSGTLSEGNISEKKYVGYLHDKSTSCTQQGDLTKDCTGPHYYLKGCGDSIIQNCVGLSSLSATEHTLAKNAFVCLTDQGGTNTATGNIIRNCIFLCADLSKIGCLAAYDPRSGDPTNPQYGKFVNNTYIIPDTVDVSSTPLFGYLQHETPNYTLTQWNAINANAGESLVTNDRIVQLPASEIDAMITDYYNRAAGGGGGLIDGVITSLIS